MNGKNKTSAFGSKLCILTACILVFATCFTTACQPTPEKPVVQSKNDGTLESALAAGYTDYSQSPYDAPKTVKKTVTGLVEGREIVFDADVEIPQSAAYPVYVAQQHTFDQTDADSIIRALLGDATLYVTPVRRSKSVVKQKIDYYEGELKGCTESGHNTDFYTELLKELYDEYQSAPEDGEVLAQKASTKMEFNKDVEGLIHSYGKEVSIDKDTTTMKWDVDGIQRAKDAGNTGICGVGVADSGRTMSLEISNFVGRSGKTVSLVRYRISGADTIGDVGGEYSYDAALKFGNEFVAKYFPDFEVLSCEEDENVLSLEDGNLINFPGVYNITLSRKLDGVCFINAPQALLLRNGFDMYRPTIEQESMLLVVDRRGIMMFEWHNPVEIAEVANAGVELMSFDSIPNIIAQQIKNNDICKGYCWTDDMYEAKNRRVVIKGITLSYRYVVKKGDISKLLLVPVWEVSGDVVLRFDPAQFEDTVDPLVLDENNELNMVSDRVIVTINALDGTIFGGDNAI